MYRNSYRNHWKQEELTKRILLSYREFETYYCTTAEFSRRGYRVYLQSVENVSPV